MPPGPSSTTRRLEMAITAKMVSELREMTGAAMMDCKKALEATGGDAQAALDHLRKQGLKSAAKKSGRETAEGRVFAVVPDDAKRGHLVGVACETDFLSSSDGFKEFVEKLSTHVGDHDPKDGEDLAGQSWQEGGTVGEALSAMVGQFGENVRVTDLVRLENVEGAVGTYIHHDNKQGAIVSVTTGADAATARETLKSLCQHVVVFMPAHTNREDVPADEIAREEAVIRESDEVKSKPDAVRDKIVQGKLSKFYATCVLADQPWIHDDKMSVQKALEKDLGAGTRIEAFTRVKLGA